MAPVSAKRVIVLVGPKGSGKTTIGRLIEARLGLRFVRVEPMFLEVRNTLGASHPDYERNGFEAVRARLTSELAAVDTVCFETTGASRHLEPVLAELGRSATVLLLQVVADPAQCTQRVRDRDQSAHIPVSDDQVERINALAFAVDLPWAASIDNRGPLDPDSVVETCSRVLTGAPPGASPHGS